MKKPSFEEALKQLEDIVESLENGALSLDDSIKIYQKGMELSNLCTKQLDQAESKISILVKANNGDMKEEAFMDED